MQPCSWCNVILFRDASPNSVPYTLRLTMDRLKFASSGRRRRGEPRLVILGTVVLTSTRARRSLNRRATASNDSPKPTPSLPKSPQRKTRDPKGLQSAVQGCPRPLEDIRTSPKGAATKKPTTTTPTSNNDNEIHNDNHNDNHNENHNDDDNDNDNEQKQRL